jgi:hypothetical protein
VIASHREVKALCEWIRAAFDFACSSPIDFEGIAVLFRARHFAAAAADALRHVEVKAVLLARPGPDRGFALPCPIQQE